MAAQSTGQSDLAKRYAKAFFTLAQDKKQIDQLEKELCYLNDLLKESPEMRRVVESPVMSRSEQGKAMAAIVEQAGISNLTGNLLGLMAKNRRLFTLSSVILAFQALVAEDRGEISAEVTSADVLKTSQIEMIEKTLKNIVGRDVSLEAKVDPGLVGGLIIKVGSRMIDNSIRTKLESLELAMKGI